MKPNFAEWCAPLSPSPNCSFFVETYSEIISIVDTRALAVILTGGYAMTRGSVSR